MKKCITCEIEKEEAEFSKAKANKDGLGNCKSCVKECKKEYYQANKERIKECHKKYYQANKERKKEQIKECHKKYYQDNKEKINKKTLEYQKVKRLKDPLYKMKGNLRTRTSTAFRNKGYNKNSKTQKMLGVSWEVCKAHIQRQFTKGMTWDNSAEWHIDHIIPLTSANTEEELKKLCHYSNLQPLWAIDNLMKSAKINGQQNKFRF
tara:strand:- start:9 stop:629 length:621 start_codon:yes stop_codon:yes gene_type:complete